MNWLEEFLDEHPENTLATSDCKHCNGEGVEIDYEGYPMPMPSNYYICRCIEIRAFSCGVEYFERPEMDYDKKPDNWQGIWIPF